MADVPRNPEPPKIKLNLPGSKPQGAPSIPPRIKIKPADKKSETARIDLAAAQPPAPGKAEDFQELTKEELAEFYKKSTIRIDANLPDVGDTRDVAAPAENEAMRTTMRVDDMATATGDTHKVQADAGTTDATKRATMRVDAAAAPGDTRKVKSETMRVDSGLERKKSETAKLEVPVSERAKQSTSRIAIDAAASSENEDVFKKRTPPVAVPSLSPPPPPAPRTPTVSLPRPKTMVMRPAVQRPVSAAPKVNVTPVAPAAVSEAKKSETARLDLPPETVEDRPTTRPKTIRIKRPDGTTARKPLMISRPDEAGAAPAVAAGEAVEVAGDDTPGAVFAIAALLAVLVTAALVYLLVAQTVAPTLPLPGRLV